MSRFPKPGEEFAGYRLESELGRGGFAAVFRASNAQGTFALKVLLPSDDGTYEQAVRARFARELDALSSLRSPHIVHLFGHGEDRGLIYMVFELLPGQSLADLLDTRQRLSPGEVVHILDQVFAALEEAHNAGVLHRDLKPDNIHVIPTPHDPLFVKLLDFGIARGLDAHHPNVTRTGEIVGTPRYMSPEQLMGKPLTSTSDIYSAGMVAYEMLMGTVQMPGTSVAAQLERLQKDHVFSIDEQQVFGPIVQAVQSMTARETDERPQSARAARAMLHGPSEAPTRRDIPSSHPEEPPSGRGILVGAIVVFVLAAGVAGFVATRTTEPPPEPVIKKVERENPFAAPTQTAVNETENDAGARDGLDAEPSDGCGRAQPGGLRQSGEAVYVLPRDYDPNKRYPLVIAVHDSFQRPITWVRENRLDQAALDGRYILIAPSDFDGKLGVNSWMGLNAVDKVKAARDWARESYCVDDKTWFVSQGTGAIPLLELRCDPDVAGIAALGFSPRHRVEAPFCDSPAPTLWMHSMKSSYVPLEHGEADCRDTPRWGVEEVEKALRTSHQCDGKPRTTVKHRGGTCETWDCESELEFCRITGNSRWTGAGQPDYERFINQKCAGDPANTFPMTKETLRFLKL